MVITIETVCIVQFTYFSLVGVGALNPMFTSMAEGLKYTSGYDLALGSQETKIKSLASMGIESPSILNNVNASLAIPLIFMVFGFVYSIFEKRSNET